MNREQIIDLAHVTDLLDEQHYGSVWATRIINFAKAVAAHERNECAKVCEALQSSFSSTWAPSLCAHEIRKRGEE